MNLTEFSNLFDLLYNNITSNQAPGLSEYEKSVFLTKAQDEIVKNYFSPQSKGNNLLQGFDDSAKRQADFSVLMKTASCNSASIVGNEDTITYSYTENGVQKTASFIVSRIDGRSKIYTFPSDVFIVVNETLSDTTDTTNKKYFLVIPLKYDEYTRLMSKPFKRPLKNLAWRLINSGNISDNKYIKCVEVVTTPEYDNATLNYAIRYVRKPYPIILGDLDGLTINGKRYNAENPVLCELDPILHEDILQRAVELAKAAWVTTGAENVEAVMNVGQRTE